MTPGFSLSLGLKMSMTHRPFYPRQLTSNTRTGSSNPLDTNSSRSANKKPLPEQRPRTVSAATSIPEPTSILMVLSSPSVS